MTMYEMHSKITRNTNRIKDKEYKIIIISVLFTKIRAVLYTSINEYSFMNEYS